MDNIVLIVHFLAFGVAFGGGVASYVVKMHMSGTPPETIPHFGALRGKLGRVSFVGLIFLWITGIWLVVSIYSGTDGLNALFSLKIAIVLVLTACAVLAQYYAITAARNRTPPPMAKLNLLGQAITGLAAVAVIFAVASFH